MRSKFEGLQRWLAANWNGLLVAALIVAGLLAIWFFLEPIAEHFSLPKSGRLDIVRVYLLAAGGGLLLWQIFIANRRASSAERTNELMALSNVTDRLNSATANLSSESVIVRIGGIYQLHQIATDADEYRYTVLKLLQVHLAGISLSITDPANLCGLLRVEYNTVLKMIRQVDERGGVYYE